MTQVVGTLWGNERQRQSRVILSVAAVNGFELEQPQWSFVDRPPEYTTKFPYGKIPAFEGTDGFRLVEGTTIARYLCSIGTKVNLLGFDAHETATIDQWVHFAEHELGVPTQNNMGMIYASSIYGTFSLETVHKNAERLARALVYLESHLAASQSGHVALDRLTFADFVLASVVWAAACVSLGSAERAKYPHVFAHCNLVTGGESVRRYWGTGDFVDAPITEPKTFPTR